MTRKVQLGDSRKPTPPPGWSPGLVVCVKERPPWERAAGEAVSEEESQVSVIASRLKDLEMKRSWIAGSLLQMDLAFQRAQAKGREGSGEI